MTERNRIQQAIEQDCREREQGSPGPWFYDSYSKVGSAPLVQSWDDLPLDTISEDEEYPVDPDVCWVRPKYGDTAPPGSKQFADAHILARALHAGVLAEELYKAYGIDGFEQAGRSVHHGYCASMTKALSCDCAMAVLNAWADAVLGSRNRD